MDQGIGPSAEMERVAKAYAGLLAGFHSFTLRRYADGPGVIRELAVYRGDEPGEVGQLRRLLAARPSDLHCMCMGSASISLDGGPTPAVLSVHHGESVRWLDAMYGDFFLERGRELAEWLAARGVADVREEMDESEQEEARYDAEERTWVAAMPASLLGHQEAIRSVVASRLSSACRRTGRRVRCPPSSAGQRSWTPPRPSARLKSGGERRTDRTRPAQAEFSRIRAS